MTAKLKTNILYIASDQSSNEQNLPEKETKKSDNDSKLNQKAFNITGSHKLNNNLISKGLFFNQTNETDYEYEHSKMKSSPQIKLKETPRKTLIRQKQSNLDQTKHLKTQILEPVLKQQTLQKKASQISQIKKQAIKRSKTLMFQFNQQQSDNEIPNNLKQEEVIRKEIEKVSEKQAFQIHRQKSNQQSSQAQTLEQKKVLTPTHMQQKIDKKQFVLAQIAKNQILQCRITKKNQFSNILLSQFDMRFRNYLSFVASCKKFLGNIGSNYRLSLDAEDFRNSSRYVIGKIRSYEGKDIYNIYDDGVNPENSNNKNQKPRQMLATVRIRTHQGPRELEVYVLRYRKKYSELLGKNLGAQPNLETLYNIEENRKSIHLFKSRKPQWVQQKREYFLNFRGKINEASIRNFILEDSETKEQVLLFGKSSNNNYNIDISYPLTPMLGFALVIPQLDRDD